MTIERLVTFQGVATILIAIKTSMLVQGLHHGGRMGDGEVAELYTPQRHLQDMVRQAVVQQRAHLFFSGGASRRHTLSATSVRWHKSPSLWCLWAYPTGSFLEPLKQHGFTLLTMISRSCLSLQSMFTHSKSVGLCLPCLPLRQVSPLQANVFLGNIS